MKAGKKTTTSSTKKPHLERYILRLYVVGKTPNGITAMHNLKKICEEYLPQNYQIEIIDLLKFPHLAKEDQILAIPTVIKKLPGPINKMIGDLSNKEAVLIGLDLKSHNDE